MAGSGSKRGRRRARSAPSRSISRSLQVKRLKPAARPERGTMSARLFAAVAVLGLQTAAGIKLSPLNIDGRSVVAAGQGHSGSFAHQLHVAYSSLISGACVFSGPPLARGISAHAGARTSRGAGCAPRVPGRDAGARTHGRGAGPLPRLGRVARQRHILVLNAHFGYPEVSRIRFANLH